MVQAAPIETFFNNPEGAQNCCEHATKNEDNQFALTITEKVDISPDTIRIRLAFPDPDWIIGIPVAQHIKIFSEPTGENGDQLCRPYTPTTPINQKGYIEFVIKCYPETEQFPDGGKMGKFIRTKNVGDTLLLEGPLGLMTYKGNGLVWHKRKGERRVTKIGLIAGGSGITPMFSLADSIYRAKEAGIDVKLLYSNKTRADILIREQLDAMNADEAVPNVKVVHTITREEGDLGEGVRRGRVTIDLLREIGFPAPADDMVIMMCGPKAMNEATKALLLENGYTEEMVWP